MMLQFLCRGNRRNANPNECLTRRTGIISKEYVVSAQPSTNKLDQRKVQITPGND